MGDNPNQETTPEDQRAALICALAKARREAEKHFKVPSEQQLVLEAIKISGLNITPERAKHMLGITLEPKPVGPVLPGRGGFDFV